MNVAVSETKLYILSDVALNYLAGNHM